MKRGMLLLLVFIFVFSLMPGAALAVEGKGKGKPEVTGQDRAAEARAEAEARSESKTETKEPPQAKEKKEETPKPVVQPPEPEVSIPTPVKPGRGPSSSEPVLGDPPVYEPEEPVSIWVNINPDHIGTTVDCAANWHFVLVGLGKGAEPGLLTVTFEKAGTIVVDPSKVLLQMQHFDITLSSGDKLIEAYAQVMLPKLSEHVRLNLSDVTCITPPPPSDEPTPTPPPPGEELTPTVPPVEPKEPSPKPAPKPEPVAYEVIVKSAEEPYLPYTGGNYGFLLGLSTIFGSAGLGLRRLGGAF